MTLYNADCIEQMQEMIDEGVQVDSVVTDPPYGINADKMTLGTGKKDFHRGDWDNKKPDIVSILNYCDKITKRSPRYSCFKRANTFFNIKFIFIRDSSFV